MIPVKIAFREILNTKRYFLVFTISILIGLISFSLLEYFKTSFFSEIELNSKKLLGADVSISSRYPISEDDLVAVDTILTSNIKRSYNPSMFSMASVDSHSSLVSVTAVGGGFPFYGELKSSHKNISSLAKDEVLVYSEFHNFFNTKIGDKVKIGDGLFTLVGIIEEDSRQSLPMAEAAPKVFMSLAGIEYADLIQFGSTVRYTYFYKLSKEISTKQLDDIRIKLDPSIRIVTPLESSQQSGRIIGYINDFLGIVSIIAILLSSIGIFYLNESFLNSRQKDFKIYLNIGFKRFEIFSIYFIQVLFVSFLGVVLTVILSSLLGPSFLKILGGFVSNEFEFNLDFIYLLKVFSVGILLNLSLIAPMIQEHLDRTYEISSSFIYKLIKFMPFLILIIFLCFWLSKSLTLSFAFLGAILLGSIFVYFSLSKILLFLARKRFRNFKLNQLVRYISYNKFSTIILFQTLFFCCLFFSLIPQLQQNILSEISIENNNMPSLFLFDIQEEQVNDLVKLSNNRDFELTNISPMIRSRITKINNIPYQLEYKSNFTREEQREFRFRNRGMNLSYRLKLDESEKIVKGKEFSGVYLDPTFNKVAEISLEERFANRLGLEIDDILEFDVLGLPVSGRIVNLRKVKWTSFVPNFFILFQPGVLEDAPKTFLGVIRNNNKILVSDIQKNITSSFSNISSVDVVRVIERITSLVSNISKILLTMSVLTLLVGCFVIVVILNNQLNSRTSDVALYKIFGLSSKDINYIYILEFSVVTFLASSLGVISCWGLSYIISSQFFDGAFLLNLTLPLSIIFLMTLISYLVVVIFSFRVIKLSPSILLEEN